jgi:hypothetical protein
MPYRRSRQSAQVISTQTLRLISIVRWGDGRKDENAADALNPLTLQKADDICR